MSSLEWGALLNFELQALINRLYLTQSLAYKLINALTKSFKADLGSTFKL